jgi:hypothetical protein
MYYSSAVMRIFEPHLSSEESEAAVSLEPEMLEVTETFQQIFAKARVQFETLVRIYYLRHSFECFNPLIIHFLSVFSFLNVGDFARTDKDPERLEATYSSLILAAKGIRDQARSCQIAQIISQLIRNILKSEQAWLWKDGVSVEQTEIDQLQMLQHTRSNYPVDIVNVAGDVGKQRVDNLINEIVGAHLRDSSGLETSSRDTTPSDAPDG